MAPTKIKLLWLGILAIAFAGCQSKPPFASVEGTVTQDGKPLAGVIVDFYPDPLDRGPRSTSDPTDESGHYRLRSTGNGSEDGAVVGPHRVCITMIRIRKGDILGRRPKKAAKSKEIKGKFNQLKAEESPPSTHAIQIQPAKRDTAASRGPAGCAGYRPRSQMKRCRSRVKPRR